MNNPSQPIKSVQPMPSIGNCHVMVVDNEIEVCQQIKEALNNIGVQNVILYQNGEDCLNNLNIAAPDLLILELNLPGTKGLEVLEIIRSQPLYDNLPIIIETGPGSPADVKKALSMGASNIMRKPIDLELLGSRVKLHLENAVLLDELREYKHRLAQELNSAHDMQKRLMPRDKEIETAEASYNFKIDACYHPSTELGGDLWGIQYLNDKLIGFYLVDFSGHGVGASINTFRLHTIMQQFPAPVSPARYLKFLSSQIHDILLRGQFATMTFALIDIENDTLSYAVAGSPPPLIYYPDSDQLIMGEGSGLPIGIHPDAEYENIILPFPAGASLLMYSDAYYESPGKDGKIMGVERVEDTIRETIDPSSNELSMDRVLKDFFKNRSEFVDDDLTLVLASRLKS